MRERAAVIADYAKALEDWWCTGGEHMRERKVVVEHEGEVELGRDCTLENFFLALDTGMFAEEWDRQHAQALAMLERMRLPPHLCPEQPVHSWPF